MSGMRGVLVDVHRAATSCNYNVLILTETWLKSDHLDAEIFDSTWQIFRCDRHLLENQDRGGGVLIAIHNSIPCFSVDIQPGVNDNNLCQQVWVKLVTKDKDIFLGGCYIHPDQPVDIYNHALSQVSSIVNAVAENDDIFLFGDFNLPNLGWLACDDNNVVYDPVNITTEQQSCVIDFFSGIGFNQICYLKNDFGNVLDLVFTNVSDNFVLDETCSLVSNKTSIFHKIFNVNYFFADNHRAVIKESKLTYDFINADYNHINAVMSSISWPVYTGSIDERVIMFHQVLKNIFENFVPRKVITSNSSPPWYDKKLINLKNIKNRAHRKWVSSNIAANYDIFTTSNEQFVTYEKICYDRFIAKTGSTLLHNPRHFYKFINYKRNVSSCPTTMQFDGTVYSDSTEICEKFASFFSSVYSPPLNVNDVVLDHIASNSVDVSEITITLQELTYELQLLNENKGMGPDEISPIFLKRTVDNIAAPLLVLFNLSLSSGSFPSSWKDSFLSPIFKSGDRSNIKNYRGIAILSVIPKLLEKIVTVKLYASLGSIINIHQHGFVKGRSTTTNLADFTSYILCEMDMGNQIDAIYTDFSKAFDKVDHGLLIAKLKKIGVNGATMEWLQSYLSNRLQYVRFHGAVSRAVHVTSGVPQGSHLGPLLFIIFINDLPDLLISCRFLLYADDLKIFYVVKNDIDAILLQRNLDVLTHWCEVNGMSLNVDKCSVISFYRRLRSPYIFNYKISDTVLTRSNLIKDLGIILDSKLTFKQQVDKVCSKSKSMLGFVKRRAQEFSDPYVTKSIYCSLVRSLLEYCCVIWSPYYECDIKRLESIQKQFLIFSLRDLGWNRESYRLPPYRERLKLINMDSLSNRRELAEALFAFDLIKNNMSSQYLSSKATVIVHQRSLRFPKFLWEINRKSTYANNEPFNRCCKTFNKFSRFYDVTISRDTFKLRILEFMKL